MNRGIPGGTLFLRMKKSISLTVILSFIFSLNAYPIEAGAQSVLDLPAPGAMVDLSPAYQPAVIKGLTIHKDNPFLFDFILDPGQEHWQGDALKKESEKLIKYFLVNLAVPEKEMWVNLSPYEKDRIIPQALGKTEMGRDLLAQDYMLKQITASLIYPEKNLGKAFWDRVYRQAGEQFKAAQIPVNTFNKVWIMADKAEIYEHHQTVFVISCHLKVMLAEDYEALRRSLAISPKADGGLEEDYLSLKHHAGQPGDTLEKGTVPLSLFPKGLSPFRGCPLGNHSTPNEIIRQIILPQLEREVNEGKNFANLRQIFNSIILSSWYKNNLKNALLNEVFADKDMVKGLDLKDPGIKEKIYERYVQAYKKGVFNFIKEDQKNGRIIHRKYFSGGIDAAMAAHPAVASFLDAIRSIRQNLRYGFMRVMARVQTEQPVDASPNMAGPARAVAQAREEIKLPPLQGKSVQVGQLTAMITYERELQHQIQRTPDGPLLQRLEARDAKLMAIIQQMIPDELWARIEIFRRVLNTEERSDQKLAELTRHFPEIGSFPLGARLNDFLVSIALYEPGDLQRDDFLESRAKTEEVILYLRLISGIQYFLDQREAERIFGRFISSVELRQEAEMGEVMGETDFHQNRSHQHRLTVISPDSVLGEFRQLAQAHSAVKLLVHMHISGPFEIEYTLDKPQDIALTLYKRLTQPSDPNFSAVARQVLAVGTEREFNVRNIQAAVSAPHLEQSIISEILTDLERHQFISRQDDGQYRLAAAQTELLKLILGDYDSAMAALDQGQESMHRGKRIDIQGIGLYLRKTPQRIGLWASQTYEPQQPSALISFDTSEETLGIEIKGEHRIFEPSDLNELNGKIEKDQPRFLGKGGYTSVNQVSTNVDSRIILDEADVHRETIYLLRALSRVLPPKWQLRRQRAGKAYYWVVNKQYASKFLTWIFNINRNIQSNNLEVPKVSRRDLAMLSPKDRESLALDIVDPKKWDGVRLREKMIELAFLNALNNRAARRGLRMDDPVKAERRIKDLKMLNVGLYLLQNPNPLERAGTEVLTRREIWADFTGIFAKAPLVYDGIEGREAYISDYVNDEADLLTTLTELHYGFIDLLLDPHELKKLAAAIDIFSTYAGDLKEILSYLKSYFASAKTSDDQEELALNIGAAINQEKKADGWDLEFARFLLKKAGIFQGYVIDPGDKAQNSQAAKHGGIDLATSATQWKVGGDKVQMNVDKALLARFRHEGFNGIRVDILQMSPVKSLDEIFS